MNLSDYDFERDIDNRILMSDFSDVDLQTLEEILFSPLKISYKKLSLKLEQPEKDLEASLQKFSQAGLLKQEGDVLLVDKEMRKYFEFQIQRFDPDFKPDMEFLQGLLKNIPIHILPNWYSIPRTSNNIFESIVEKCLFTPQIFQRHLAELQFSDPLALPIMEEVLNAPDLQVFSSDLIAKYNLDRRRFEQILLLLEFHFVCCLKYEKEDDHWVEILTPFYEWQEYLRFLKQTQPRALPKDTHLQVFRPPEFAFIQDAKKVIETVCFQKLKISSQDLLSKLAPLCHLPLSSEKERFIAYQYLTRLTQKIQQVHLVKEEGGSWVITPGGTEWLNMTPENQAIFLYRHPFNTLEAPSVPKELKTEKTLREAEKSIKHALSGDWILFEEFLKGVLVPLNEESVICLTKTGKHWKYQLPKYREEEKELIKAVIFEGLFETGMTSIGTYQGEDCFCVTPFGRFFFQD